MKNVVKSVKLIVVGSCGVGKTALITKFQKKTFAAETNSTVSPASSTANISLPDNVTASLQIWDTAGQERFQSISTMFYRESNVAFVCFDHESFDSIEQWVNRVRTEEPSCKIILVLTKADLLDPNEEIEANGEGTTVQKALKASGFYMTSSVDGRNVNEVFYEAAMIAGKTEVQTTSTVKIDSESKKSSCC